MKIRSLILSGCLFLNVTGLVAQIVDVDVNLNVIHKLGDVTEFDRARFVTMHYDNSSSDWFSNYSFTDNLAEDFLDGYDVYLGRNTGGVQWIMNSVIRQDPNRPGFADTTHIASEGLKSRNNYAGHSEYHPYEARNKLVLCAQIHPFYPDGTLTQKGWAFSTTDTQEEPFGTASGEFYAHYVKEFFGTGGTNGQPSPKYIEVLNEPLWHINDFEQVFKFHNTVAKEVRSVNPDALVGGYCTAFPDLEVDGFQRWEARWKKFMDMSGDYMDFWAIHLYDFPSISGGQKRLRRGSNVEATLDMLEQYSIMKFGLVKPFVITEYGASSHDYSGAWSPYRDYLHNTACNALMMQFMERTNNIGLAINYTMMKATWGTPDVNNTWGARLLRREDEPVSLTGDWIYSDRIMFYQLWENVKGTRVDSRPYHLDIMADAFVEGNKAFVVLNNLAWEEKNLAMNIFEEGSLDIDQLMVKHYRLDNSNPVFDRNGGKLDTIIYNSGNIPSVFTIAAEGTMVLEYSFASELVLSDTSNEVKYYATDYYKAIQANTAILFEVNGVEKGLYGDATLRVGLGRNHGKSLLPDITVNGAKVNVPTDFRGDIQEDRETFFGVIEINVPYDSLQENNIVEITFPDGGGHVSTVSLQVFSFSREIGRSGFGAVSGIYVSPDNYTLEPGQSLQLEGQVLPALAYNQLIHWSSGDTSLATVDAQGKVLAGSADGTVTVFGTSDEGGFIDSCVLRIRTIEPGWLEADDPDKYITTEYVSGDSIEILLDYFAGTDRTVKSEYGGVQVMFRHMTKTWGVISDKLFSDSITIGTNSGRARIFIDLEGVTPSGDLENGEFYFLYPRFQSSNGEKYYVHGLSPITVIADPSIGIEPRMPAGIKVYPNPSDKFVTFSLAGADEMLLCIYNPMGQIVFSDKILAGESVNLESLNNGLFYYTVAVGSERYRGSLVLK